MILKVCGEAKSSLKKKKKKGVFIYLAVPGFSCSIWLRHVGSSSLIRDQTWAPCIGRMES